MKLLICSFVALAFVFVFEENAYSKRKSDSQFIYDRMDELMNTSDTLIVYFRGFGGSSIGGLEGSAYFLYLKEGKYYMEYYRWKSGTEKFIQKFKTKRKEKEIKAIITYANKNIDCMRNADKSKIQLDISDGIYAWYIIKLKSSVFKIHVNGNHRIQHYVESAPCIGSFLLVLNMLYYQYSFDDLIDM